MARKAVMDAVEARLAALWTRCPVAGNRLEGDTPSGATSFLAVQYPVANEERITVGAPGENVYREEGAIRFVLNAGREVSSAVALAWADELASLFRGKIFDGVETFGVSTPALDDRNDRAGYFVLSLAVPYQHDITG